MKTEKSSLVGNHLGNVLQVVTDRKLAVDDGDYDPATGTYTTMTPDGDVDYYIADVVSQSDYFPFGMVMPNRNDPGTNEYRYSFQGQEKDDEIKGNGNSINYKYRMHDPRVGRFFAVDPLAVKYPHNGPYNFSENIVLHGVELEGLEVFFIHGMNSKPEDWNSDGFKELGEVLMQLTNNVTIDKTFDWSGDGNGPLQTRADRIAAAEALVDHILENNVEDEEITLIGASHGGNVSIIAAKLLAEKGYKVNIITFNRASFNEEGDLENPDGNEGINDFIDIRTENDKVSNFVRGGGDGVSNEYNGPGQKLRITNDKKFFLFRHATRNSDEAQVQDAIDNGELVPLKPVPAGCSPSALYEEVDSGLPIILGNEGQSNN